MSRFQDYFVSWVVIAIATQVYAQPTAFVEWEPSADPSTLNVQIFLGKKQDAFV